MLINIIINLHYFLKNFQADFIIQLEQFNLLRESQFKDAIIQERQFC